jgi:hypothetical protein
MNQTIHLQKGEEFTVQLGGGLHWTITFDPASAITEVSGSSTDGVQGVYRTVKQGAVTLKATGAPICKAGQACPMFLAEFTATILVQ